MVKAWALSMESPFGGPWHEFNAGASNAELDAAEEAIGRRLPEPLRALYRFSNGMGVLGGDLNFVPLAGPGDTGNLVTLSDELRSSQWPIPDEMIVFGGNGADEIFGIWLPTDEEWAGPALVVGVGEIFEPDCLAVYGTSLSRFLRAWTAARLLEWDDHAAALDALGLPTDRRRDPSCEEEAYAECFGWADPDLPYDDPDPYSQRLTPKAIREMFGAS